jgi:hypothetical protein
MKNQITITASPNFLFQLNLKEVSILEKLCHMHYDHTCRQLAEHGGLIYGWVNLLCDFHEPDELPTLSLDARQADLLTQVLEIGGYLQTEEEREFIKQLRTLIDKGFRLIRLEFPMIKFEVKI